MLNDAPACGRPVDLALRYEYECVYRDVDLIVINGSGACAQTSRTAIQSKERIAKIVCERQALNPRLPTISFQIVTVL